VDPAALVAAPHPVTAKRSGANGAAASDHGFKSF
jgi:hypothetical protein